MMGSFEWMELETLSHEISSSQNRLEAARWAKDEPLIKSLQRNLAELEERRGQLLTRLGSSVTSHGSEDEPPAPNAAVGEDRAPDDRDADPPVAEAPAEEVVEEAAEEPEAAAQTEQAGWAETAGPFAPAAAPPVIVPEPPQVTPPAAPTVIVTPPPAAPTVIVPPAPVAAAPNPAPPLEPRLSPIGAHDAPAGAWNNLAHADLDRAKQDLVLRRAEMLARHAEELRALETDQAEIEVLERAIANFVRKYSAPSPTAEVVHLMQERQPRRQTGS
jgi:hypothetical protein